MNAEKDRSSGNWRYIVVAGKAKWESRVSCPGFGQVVGVGKELLTFPRFNAKRCNIPR
jgi:hypothetical protein